MAGKRTVIKVNGVSLDQIDDAVMLTDLVSVAIVVLRRGASWRAATSERSPGGSFLEQS